MSMATYHATFDLPRANALALEDWFDWPDELFPVPTIALFETEDPALWRVDIYLEALPGDDAIRFISSLLQEKSGVAIPTLDFNAVIERDWVSESQKLRTPISAGRFCVFEPHFRDQVPADAVAIQLEVGQAFGSGSHESTMGCLLALDHIADVASPKSALDLGTGSGLLAIAMANVWNCNIVASDIDPVAIEVASENIANNGVGGIACIACDGFDDPAFDAARPFDVITANILAGPLIDMASEISRHLAPGGYLILSGLLIEQKSALIDAYSEAGLKTSKAFYVKNWSTLLFRR